MQSDKIINVRCIFERVLLWKGVDGNAKSEKPEKPAAGEKRRVHTNTPKMWSHQQTHQGFYQLRGVLITICSPFFSSTFSLLFVSCSLSLLFPSATRQLHEPPVHVRLSFSINVMFAIVNCASHIYDAVINMVPVCMPRPPPAPPLQFIDFLPIFRSFVPLFICLYNVLG